MLRARLCSTAITLVALSLPFASVLVAVPALAREMPKPEPVPHIAASTSDERVAVELGLSPRAFVTAASNTTVLYSEDFDNGLACTTAGWIEVDITAQLGDFFHVDDYAGLSFGPVRGTKSLWCGARPSASFCNYATLPGYGNKWDQAFCTKVCFTYSGTVAVDCRARWDIEPGYDFLQLERSPDCSGYEDWVPFTSVIDGIQSAFRHDTFTAPLVPARIRFRFVSDASWSDEDGQWPTNGAVHIDSLCVRDASGVRIAVEEFEDEPNGVTSTEDWTTCNMPGFGSPAFLTRGASVLQQDPCLVDLSCLWAFFENSTNTYACGGFPNQLAVPSKNSRGQYLDNEIWSPPIPLIGTGNKVLLRFSVYRDMPLEALIFYKTRVRALVNGCWSQWNGNTFIFYYGGNRDWLTTVENMAGFFDLVNATHIQVSLGVLDNCPMWCSVFGCGGCCHSQAPLFDNVEVLRVDDNRPQWTIRDIDQFQDNFSTDGTITGTARADMANDILPNFNLSILPGDSAVVTVADPISGIANDGALGGKKIYGYVAVWPQGQATKTGANLSGGSRWPFAGTQVIGGVTWTRLRLDQCILNGNPVANVFCLDLNDDLFKPGDEVRFFYGAENTNGVVTYAFGSSLQGQGDDVAEAAANAAEFTCLPTSWQNTILYVDGMDGRGAQPYWDTALQHLHRLDDVDRYDVRGPTSNAGNRLDGRVQDVLTQILGQYQAILWDCGDLSATLGDGSGSPDKTNDWDLMNTYLDNHEGSDGGIYICGDDVFQQLAASSAPSAVTFRTTYLTFSLTSASHIASFGTSPVVKGVPGNYFVGDTFVVYGGCPLLNDFDVVAPTGASLMEASYGDAGANNGAILSRLTLNSNNHEVAVLVSGFAFEYIRDDENNGILDRADHLHDILTTLTSITPLPTGTSPVARNSLSQNYPNPFNPTTTIAFSLKERGAVTLHVYDVAGALIRTLAEEEMPAGSHTRVWDGRDSAGAPAASGVYFYKLNARGFEQTKKMVLLK